MSTDLFFAIPAGSLGKLPDEGERREYIEKIFQLPRQVKDTATSTKVAAYIRGLVKSHTLPPDSAPKIAFVMLQSLIGERPLAQMAAQLSSDLGIANDKAQRIAQEIERDIFAPISIELNKHLSGKKKQKSSVTENITPKDNNSNQPTSRFPRTPASPPNVLNLKNNPKPPAPPPIPKKDDSTPF